MDFFVNLPTQPGQLPDGTQVMVAPFEVVARVRFNPKLAWKVASELAAAVEKYEGQHGAIGELNSGRNLDAGSQGGSDAE